MEIKSNYQSGSKYATSGFTHPTHKLSGNFGMGIFELAKLQCGKTTYELLGHKARFTVTFAIGQPENYLDHVIAEIAPQLVKATEECLRANISDEELAAYIEKKDIMSFPDDSKPVERKLTKAEQQVKEIVDLIHAAETSSDKVALVNSYGVFNVTYSGEKMFVRTSHTISKTAYNKCRKMGGGAYLKEISFTAALTKMNIFDLIDISIKTKKVGQEKLQKNKQERLQRKYSGTSSSTRNNKTSFDAWYEDADMPEKINGVWVDLETGLTYNGK
ncbi:hypothetical protein [Burkholderia cenocepacia]|uniref:hypothetical protein n=1 Tax=Burkholderia cenocepacia TaxID=95486 RepID=UPI002232BF59|nr:hypothetical protein [Burkholderia cenocepacia]MCW3498726.1 hypothetical protein [Burkholderia cenocepacia]MCW3506186.1 hypothetical protein [Burkholderia cenocepacia]MCW3513879.1 hypothetical protein [Burkholderia cenocepacia]MCW3529029.1 hypothetical protein [Burkholderia cenocepacia]MCW3544637.1 hypothetical protein [Burkholderia cenocepacia]